MRKVGAFLLEEFLHILPPTLFFLFGFNLIVLTSQWLQPGAYGLQLVSFVVATTAALVVGKAVLVADKMPFLRRFDGAPLIQPILFKTFVYWMFVFIARLLEQLIHFLVTGGALLDFPADLAEHFAWRRFIAVQLWILVLFLIYVTASELNTLFGDGELAAILFRRRSSALKLTRRQRIRALTRVSRITEAHTLAELRDPGTSAHQEMVALLIELTHRSPSQNA